MDARVGAVEYAALVSALHDHAAHVSIRGRHHDDGLVRGGPGGERRDYYQRGDREDRTHLFFGGLRLVDLDDEFGAAHAHDGGRGADLHRLGRLLDDAARDHRERALGKRAVELAGVRGGIEDVAVDREAAVGTDRE